LYYTFIVKKIGLGFTISFAGYSPITLADSAALYAHLQTNFINSFQKLENSRQGEPINLEEIYQNCINLEDGNSFIFNVNNNVLNENLIANDSLLATDPLVYNSDNGTEILIDGTIPVNGNGNFLILSDKFLIGDFTEVPLVKSVLRSSYFDRLGDIILPTKFEIFSPLGYKSDEFIVERWSNFSEDFQVFGTPAQVTCESYTIGTPSVTNREYFVSDISYSTINAPLPENEETGIYVAIVTIDGVDYRAVVFGNISEGIVINSEYPANREISRAIFNYANYLVDDTYFLDLNKLKFKIVLYYV
jgi:hypothetical protein